jgi:ATP-dependent Lhr-like helicase
VYLNNKRETNKLYKELRLKMKSRALKLAIRYHHGSATSDLRDKVEKGLADGSIRIVIATDSLGMGADIPDIHRVVQVRAGVSLGATVQRIGRAGRAGNSQAEGIVLYEPALTKQKKRKVADVDDEDQEEEPAPVANTTNVRSYV